MAGETVLPIQETPDFIQDITWNAPTEGNGYFYYCERDTVVDSVVAINDGADAGLTVDITKGAGGTSILSSAITIAAADTTGVGTLDTSENLVPAGTWLHLTYADGTSDADSTAGLCIQARIRTTIR